MLKIENTPLPAPLLRTGRADNSSQDGSGDCVLADVSSVGFACPFCEKVCKSAGGLGVHKRHAHPLEANKDVAPIVAKRRWRDEEVAILAKTEARLTFERGSCGNQELVQALPEFGRTLEAIKGRRKNPQYKALVQTYLAECQEAPVLQVETEHEVLPDVPLESPPAANEHPANTRSGPSAAEVLAGLLQRAASRTAKKGSERRTAGRRRNLIESDNGTETVRVSNRNISHHLLMVFPGSRRTDRIAGAVPSFCRLHDFLACLVTRCFLSPYKIICKIIFLFKCPWPFSLSGQACYLSISFAPKFGLDNTKRYSASSTTLQFRPYSSNSLRLVCQECANLRSASKFCSHETSSS